MCSMTNRLDPSPMSAGTRGWRVLAWAGALVVLTVSLIPDPAIVLEAPPNSDKLVHAGMYGGLFALFSTAYRHWPPAALAVGLAGYGIVIEYLQMLTPTRFGSLADAIANCVGISIMLLIFNALAARQQQRQGSEPGP